MSNATQSLKAVPSETATSCTLTYGDCNNRVMHDAMEKLDDYTAWTNTDTMWRFNKIKAVYDRTSKVVRRDFQKLLKKHAIHEPIIEKNAEGKLVPVRDKLGNPKMKPKMMPKGHTMDFVFHDQAAFDKDYAALMRTEFTIKAYQLPLEDLVNARLTPKQLRSIARIADNIDPDLIIDPEVADDDTESDEDTEPATDSPDT